MRYLVARCAVLLCLGGCGQIGATPTPAATPTIIPTVAPTITPVPTTPTLDIRPTQTRAAELAQIATLTVPTATSLPPTPTLTPRVFPTPTLTAKQSTACATVGNDYAKAGRTFDRAQAAVNPELALVDYRYVVVGSTGPPLNRLAKFGDDLRRQTLWACLGLPEPPIRPLT